MSKVLFAVPALMLAAALTACDQSKPAAGPAPAAPKATTAAAPTLPASLFLAAAPADAKDVKDAKPTLKAGDKVVLVGRVGGSDEPFVAQRAVFTLVDRRLKACGEGNPDDKCQTPWDYCCESRTDITANSATVQVVGTDGQPVKAELNGQKGLKPLATVTVVGTVTTAEGENFVITASGLFVTPP